MYDTCNEYSYRVLHGWVDKDGRDVRDTYEGVAYFNDPDDAIEAIPALLDSHAPLACWARLEEYRTVDFQRREATED